MPCVPGRPANKVTAVRFWSTGDTTRVAVEVSGEFKYKSDHLETPPRLFFDVQGARPGMAQKTIAVGDHLLKQIRIAETQPGTTRIVLDLEQNAEFSASQLSNPERLMVEIRAKGSKTAARAEQKGRKFPLTRKAPLSADTKALLSAPVLAAVSKPAEVTPVASVKKIPGPPLSAASPRCLSRKRRRATPTAIDRSRARWV